jgi:hypothetical protein
MKRNKYKSRDGRWIDDVIIPDGGEVRVPLSLADGYRRDLVNSLAPTDTLDAHKPGFRLPSPLARDVVRTAREEMLDRARSGWIADKRRPPDDDVGDSRARWVRSLQDAWRDVAPQATLLGAGPSGFVEVGARPRRPGITGPGPSATLANPTAGPAPERPDPNDDQAKRDAAWSRYKDQLSNAWRGMGPTAAAPSPEWTGPGT